MIPFCIERGARVPLVPSQVILSTDEMGRIAPPIFTSVGRDGINRPGDVFVIQSLLNERLPKPHAPTPAERPPPLLISLPRFQTLRWAFMIRSTTQRL